MNFNTLEELQKLVDRLREDNSSYHKEAVLRGFEHCKEILTTIYDPLVRFNITGDKVLEHIEIFPDTMSAAHEYKNIESLLNGLKDREVTGHKALESCAHFISLNEEYQDLIVDILNKDLKSGVSIKTLNKVWNGSIGLLRVPLAKEYESKRIDFKKETWFHSRKLDGIRCLAFVTKNGDDCEVVFKTRRNRVVTTLSVLEDEIKKLDRVLGMSSDYVIDGELCLIDENGNEVFQNILSEFRKKNHTIANPRFLVFDIYLKNEMERQLTDNRPYHDKLQKYVPRFNAFKSKYISWLKHSVLTDKENLADIIRTMPDEWEGVILRKDSPTTFKRSFNLLKIKKFFEADYVVERIEPGQKRIDSVRKNCCASLVINHKGHEVKVGTGFSDDERLKFYHQAESIVGKTITVKYMEETTDKAGNKSLRHSVFKCIRDYE
jgi:DNA ligase-1